MGILDRIFRDMYEQKAGRLYPSPGGWAFNPPQWLIDKTIRRCPNMHIGGKPHIAADADGKPMTFVSRRTVLCPQETCAGEYPRAKRPAGRWYFPDALCRKCQFREKASRKYRFPRCLCKASKDPGMDALRGTFGALQKAVNETEVIMGRKPQEDSPHAHP